jgi:hypothetical protein
MSRIEKFQNHFKSSPLKIFTTEEQSSIVKNVVMNINIQTQALIVLYVTMKNLFVVVKNANQLFLKVLLALHLVLSSVKNAILNTIIIKNQVLCLLLSIEY